MTTSRTTGQARPTSTVTVRELRNNSGAVLERLARGEELTVTRNGVEIAELRPRHRPRLSPADLIERRRNLPQVAPEQLGRDLDAVLDPTGWSGRD